MRARHFRVQRMRHVVASILSTSRQSPDAARCHCRHQVPAAGISYSVYDRQIQLHFTDAAAAAAAVASRDPVATINSAVAAA